MRLTKLELNGFKSFAHRTEIEFAGGITAVIGPNGSGKSNIADAVRWVLGEQSAKALRGTRMEDVIFSGTQQKKAQAYCEVTLTFDNSDGKLPLSFDEVALTRRVYRSGDSEYCINKNNCRLRDIQELFRDTGIGKDGYSIISQGKVDEILANRSGDRRVALEEAAGVMRFRVRKEEAERKLENTGKNLERIEDIVRELADRLEPLEQQSAAARTFLSLRDDLREAEINLFLYQYDKFHERLTAVADSIAAMQQEAATFAGTEQTLLSSCASLEERVRSLDAALTQQQNQLLTMLSGVESRVGECKLLAERREQAGRERERLVTANAETAARRGALKEALGRLQDDDASGAEALLCSAVTAAEEALSREDAAILEDERALEEMKNGIIEAMNRLSDARSSLSRFQTMADALRDRLTELAAERARQEEALARLETERDEADAEQAALDNARTAAKDELSRANANFQRLKNELDAANEEKRSLEQTTDAARQRHRVLREMAKLREGYYASVKSLMHDAERDARLGQAIVGVVAELIRVPKEYEQAVTMALGSALQNIVTQTAEDAQYVIEYLRRKDYGRATLLPMAILRTGALTREERDKLTFDGCCGAACDLIEYDPRIENAVRHLLGRTVIVRDLASGVALKKRAGGSFQIATLEGDIIATGGSMSGGSLQKKQFSLLGREREIAELESAIRKNEQRLTERQTVCETLQKDMLLADTQIEAFRQELQQREIACVRQTEKREIIQRDVERARTACGTLEGETARIDENLADLLSERAAAETLQTDIASGNAATREDVARAQKALAERRAARETHYAALTERKVRRMALQKERDAAARERQRLESELAAAEQAIGRNTQLIAENESLAVELQRQLDEAEADVLRGQSEAGAFKKAQQAMEDERTGVFEELTALRAQRETLLTTSRELADRLHRQELQKSRMELELTGMQDHIWEEYGLTYENALPYRREGVTVTALNARITERRNGIKALGDVNLSSIEDYKAVSERHGQLSTQSTDLRKAKTDLEALIVELTGTMQTEFARQFAIIQKNFTDVFYELFGGGHAELRLADKNDPLGCDIDIIASPPGKKLQLLSLLSGGERALTAIALLFAMLRLKPPAFCVLDEIESSLDEENVLRFASFLKDYSDDTQFILITHRKGSMEVCDSLYGVSMEERGVSRVVSAKFGDVG